MELQPPDNLVLLAQLDAARQLLERNQVEAARDQASAVLKAAEDRDDRWMQGQALMALAQYDRVVGRFRRGIVSVLRAVQLFRLDGDIAGEATALALLAHASSLLGRDEEAVEAGLLAVRLGSLLPPGAQQVHLYNYLGTSYLWSKSFGDAEVALREAERLAVSGGHDGHVLLPRINLAWLELVRLSEERYFNGVLPDTQALETRLAQCADLFESDAPFPGLPGVRAVLQRFGRCAHALLHCWRGEPDAAAQWLNTARDPDKPGNYAEVANFVVHWVGAEIHWARGDLQAAQQEASVLIDRAGDVEFEQMAYIGHMLLTQIYSQQGRDAVALTEERRYRRRQLRVRADSLDSRHRVVQAQLDMRASKRDLHQLATHAQELERLSFEDSLTGIPNRRRFEVQLSSALAAGPSPTPPTCVALIDLDDFKQINDTHSHEAGDEVLKTVAQAIRGAVRETDLAARLGGDEFVVLFARTTLEQARAMCERIQAAVAALRWAQWSPGLQVRLSIGIAESRAGDSAAELLKRSDSAMFLAKKQG